MVKIKESYTMTPRERAEYERQDALPRKESGRVDYYYKPQTKYPSRIYVFMDADLWQPRNRRPMGLHTAFPFLTRPMNKEEIEYHHFNWRLCYYQYENWDKLIYAEEKEAEQLDSDNPGTGTAFLARLLTFRQQFQLAAGKIEIKSAPTAAEDEDNEYLRELIATGDALDAPMVGRLLDEENAGAKRPAVLIVLRQLYGNFVKPLEKQHPLDEDRIRRKVRVKADRRRRNYVRRVYRDNQLFALEEISTQYPGYTEDMLWADLQLKSPRKIKRKKHTPVTDHRQRQLEKLAHLLKTPDLSGKEYHAICCKIPMLQHAHNLRLPIPLPVKLQGETQVYSFGCRIRDEVVKAFVRLANEPGMTHDRLAEYHREMRQSNYSY